MEREVKKESVDNNIVKSVNKWAEPYKKKKTKSNFPLILILCLISCGIIAVVALDRESNNSTAIETEQQGQVTSTLDQMFEQEGFIIETPIVNLHYPEKWKEQIRVEQIEGDVHTVQFIATVEGKEEVHIFDIAYGSEEGYTLGYLEDDNEEKVPVNIISYDFELGEEWTEEEKNEVYTMLEDVNYIIEILQKDARFERAS